LRSSISGTAVCEYRGLCVLEVLERRQFLLCVDLDRLQIDTKTRIQCSTKFSI
jgi:hypothetical protein